MVPFVILVLRNYPADRGVRAYGSPAHLPDLAPPDPAGAVRRAVGALRRASHSKTFRALAGGFAICGATTNGLIGTHFVPSAHDHGMSEPTAAGLLALVGIFDIVGTIVSGALTDKVNPRILLVGYYFFRGVGLLVLPWLLSDTVHPSMLIFIVIYGLDWVATVPPTVALCREAFGPDGTIVFGWVFAAHQIGAGRRLRGRDHPRLHRAVHHRLVRGSGLVRSRRGGLVWHPPAESRTGIIVSGLKAGLRPRRRSMPRPPRSGCRLGR